ncbi:MAG: SDR family oxidoreductase [Planctomycetaceae bacterium]|nr:SDR family oxidoreductase [Planctomycetaceae bacterium]
MNESPVALITGSGSRRVGSVIAAELGRRGYSLVLHYRTSKEEAERQVAEFAGRGISAIALQADLADETAVGRMFEAVRERFGRLDVLVNAAALWKKIPLEQTTAADLREHFNANALGTFLCCKFGGLMMVAQPTGGCIVNIGDWAEIRPYTDYAAYFPSKGAVTALTRSLAVELAARNPRVRVNCLLPGPVMLPDSIGPEEKQAIIEQTLVKREGRPEHIASGVAFLIENDFVTGVALPIDGGRSIHGN